MRILLPDQLIERHAAFTRAGGGEHSRTEHRRRAAGPQRFEQSGQAFRRILAVAMDERDKIVAVLERVMISKFLVSAISLIPRIKQHRNRERTARIARDRAALLEGGVARRVVDNQHVDFVMIAKLRRNPEDNFADRSSRRCTQQ